jgi:hypothetical protein
MDDPIKIIHKYKNNNKRIQYNIYIYVGDIIETNCKKILEKIEKKDLYDSLVSLNSDEIKIIQSVYGEYWYEKFFNSYHIKNIKTIVKKNKEKKSEIEKIYGKEWFDVHFVNEIDKSETLLYSYEDVIREDRERKIKNIIQMQQETEDIIDYTIGTTRQAGGDIANTDTDTDTNLNYNGWIDKIEGNIEQIEEEEIHEYPEITDENFDIEKIEAQIEKDIENFELLYVDEENDKNIDQTIKEIKKAITEDKYNKINEKIMKFPKEKDNNAYDENLKDIYSKIYVYHQYIFKDDTIKNINNKICCSFKNNNKFGENTYIVPNYQYLWSEYTFNGKVEKVMIGQKWIIKNSILKIDTEPNNNMGIYEDLRGNLKILRDNVKRQGKIKLEDDSANILYDYDGYYTHNEIFMIDIYNELGLNYDPTFEEIKNLTDIYFQIYFPRIKPAEIKNILDFLNRKTKNSGVIEYELSKLKLIFDSRNNDLILENEITKNIETIRKQKDKYVDLFKENVVIQSVIRLYLIEKGKKLDLYKIFDNFVITKKYPFIQYQSLEGASKYKFNRDKLTSDEKMTVVSKWFENSPFGISFKIKVESKENKYISVSLIENGRIDYKIHWKEEDMFTVDDIKGTHKYIYDLVDKINSESNDSGFLMGTLSESTKIPIPSDDTKFKYAFISTIQKFEFPDKYIINHDDLSEFARYFYPYVSLVIDPKKRQSKTFKVDTDVDEKGKFGTYLRYKRVSKYDNKLKIQQRIFFFMRNYEFDEMALVNEISREFNITEDAAQSEIKIVMGKYPKIKKSRKVLKKLENIPKYKPPGIGIDIQGKTRKKYKIRIAGARNKYQLNKIVSFMNIMMYLYLETYLKKNPAMQKLKDTLKNLTKIAKRIKKVDYVTDDELSSTNVKKMAYNDKERLKYHSDLEKGQWPRDCQNSGTDKKRRPQQYQSTEELEKQGYVLKDKLEGKDFPHYVKKIKIDKNGKKKEITLRALSFKTDDDNYVHYVCDPKSNGKHIYVGVLNKASTVAGYAPPCCFIKDQLTSKNKSKKYFFLKNIGWLDDNDDENIKSTSDRLYILKNTGKIQEDRFSYLPKYLNIIFNVFIGNNFSTKNRSLISSNTGFFFKYGVKQDNNQFYNCLCSIFDYESIQLLKKKLFDFLRNSPDEYFTSLNNGDIRNEFISVDNYIDYLDNYQSISHTYVNDLVYLPGALTSSGVNVLVFKKKMYVIKKKLEKEKIKETFVLDCSKSDLVDGLYDPNRKTIFIIKEKKNYYPIVLIKKKNEHEKEELVKMFSYQKKNLGIKTIDNILDYYKVSCNTEFKILIKNDEINSYSAKQIIKILLTLKKEYAPKLQIIDKLNKCRYIITNEGNIIPTIPSGIDYTINISTNVNAFEKSYDATLQFIKKIKIESKSKINIDQIGVYYDKKKGTDYNITSIMTKNYDEIPVTNFMMSASDIKKNKLLYKNILSEKDVDSAIYESNDKSKIIVDDRILNVSKKKYEKELYQLFRYHISFYLNNIEYGIENKKILEGVISDTSLKKNDKINLIKKILYGCIDAQLENIFNKLVNVATNTKYDKKIKINSDNKYFSIDETSTVDPLKIKLENSRNLCYQYHDKNTCCTKFFCDWSNDSCLFKIGKRMLVDYINKVTDEIFQNSYKGNEILRRDEYYVSDIVNYDIFTERPNETVISTTNTNIHRILLDLFGKDNIPSIGKKYRLSNINKEISDDYKELKDLGEFKSQLVNDQDNIIFRAFINSYYWLSHPYNQESTRNLGFFSDTQTKLSNLYKSQVSHWLASKKNKDEIIKNLNEYIKYAQLINFVIDINKNPNYTGNYIVELFTLSKLVNIIIIVYDEGYNFRYIFDPAEGIYDFKRNNYDSTIKFSTKYGDNIKKIYLKFTFSSESDVPSKIEALYPKK